MDNLRSKLDEITKLTEGSDSWVIVDSEGKEYSLEEAKKAKINGTPVEKDARSIVVNEVFGKSRINPEDLVGLLRSVDNLAYYIYNNSSYSAKKKMKEAILADYETESITNKL